MAAIDDLAIYKARHPSVPSVQGVFLRNTNGATQIDATVSVTASSSLTIQSPDRTASRPRWPLEFAVRVPAGGHKVLGFATFKILTSQDANGAYTSRRAIQRYAIEGAVYTGDHPSPVIEDPVAHTFFYSVPSAFNPRAFADLCVNIHPNKQLNELAEVVQPGGTTDFASLQPLGGSQQELDLQFSRSLYRITQANWGPESN
jgi:hypothetical protein